MRQISNCLKRILALLIVFGMVTGLVPGSVLEGVGVLVANAQEPAQKYELNNGYIKVTVSEETGGFGIRTVEGDKANKSDNDAYLVFEYDEDHTSFTTFQVTRGGETKEYIFGGKYWGSSDVTVTQKNDELIAKWSVDGLTFTQTISLVNTGSTEHGTALITYGVENSGESAEVKCRILIDTSLGYQDYAYYKVGNDYLEFETELGEDGYQKSFYAVTDPDDPRIVAYTINASIDDRECKPYRTVFAHWGNLASTVFDYTPDTSMNFTNFNNLKYMTSDSAYAMYFDMGEVAKNGKASAATNYGVYSNETVSDEDAFAVNVNAPDVLQFAKDAQGNEDQTAFENGGRFDVKTYIQNISQKTYSRIRIVVNAAGGIDPLDLDGNPTNSSYDSPYTVDIRNIAPGEQREIDWGFLAQPKEVGQYGKVHFKVYDVSDEATMGTGQTMMENLLGEGYSYIMCPGSVEKTPSIKFTGSSPETIFSSGIRTLNITGDNFAMLLDQASYRVMLSRVDGNKIGTASSVEIPSSLVQIDDSTNVMTVIFTEDSPGTIPDGMYQLTIDYTDTTKQDISGQALRFYVSSEVKYKNDSYSFLAVVKGDDNTYSVRRFMDEKSYWEALDNQNLEREEVLLEFQGNFVREVQEDNSVLYTGLSLNKSNNVMTMNGCLDIMNGTTVIKEKDGSVIVEFDADLYTTGAGTAVWSGVCTLTELEKGTDYGLIPYSENGERENFAAEPIALLWPSAGMGFQNLMGMLFNFRYGELGYIAHENAPSHQASQTRVMAFGAAMDLSFLIPESISANLSVGNASTTKKILGSSWDAADHNSVSFSAEEIRALNKRASYRSETAKTNATQDDVNSGNLSDMSVDDTPGYNAASIVVDDILFGGEYLGINLELALGIPPYISGLPAVEGILSIHTVGNWSFGVEGQCHFTSFSMKATIDIKSLDNVPVLNSLSFFVGGITPGFNVDGVGVLWLQGGGGGIDNLYDTIVVKDAVPPLKLIIQAQFSVMQIFSATASLGLSLRGIDVSLTNGKFSEYTNEQTGVVTVPQPITMNAGIRLDWYPEFYFQGYVNLLLASIISGNGYVVADAEGFYEFFLRAAVSVPSDVPIIGGYEVAEMNLGVNNTKLWGKASLLDLISVGLTYYWGGDFDWNSGSEVYPTYPELIGMDVDGAMVTMALDYDEASGETLYMAFGTNARMSASTYGLTAQAGLPEINDKVESDVINGSNHTMTLEQNGSGKILSIQWTSESEETAKQDAAAILIADQKNSANQYPIVVWDKDTEGANTLFTYSETTKTAYLSVVFAADDETVFDTTWNIITPAGTQLVVYDVAPLPEVTAENATINGNVVSVELGGSQLESFTNLVVFAEGKNSGQSYLLGGAENPFATDERTLTFTLPEQMVSDTYTLRIVCTDGNDTYYDEAEAEIKYINPDQPSAPTGVSAENAGDYKVAVSVGDSNEEFDGYQFTAYDANGDLVSGMNEIMLNKDGSSVSYDDNGVIVLPESNEAAESYIIGGHFEQTVKNEEDEDELLVTGLSAGDYTIEVRRWKLTAGKAVLVSEPTEVNITVREPVETVITVTAVGTTGRSTVNAVEQGSDTYDLTAFGTDEIRIQMSSAAESFTGKWRLDGGYVKENNGEILEATRTASVLLSGLSDGTHIFSFIGTNQYGDAVSATYQFTVDTLAPRMLLSAPVNGALFDYWTGELTISGVTDQGAVLAVTDNTDPDAPKSLEVKNFSVDEYGAFTATVAVDRSVMSHDLTITMTDALGNASSKDVSVMSNGLGSIEKLMIYAGDKDVTNTKLTAGGTYQLKLMAKLKTPAEAGANAEDLVVLINSEGMVDWVRTIMEGSAELEYISDGIQITTASDAEGMVTARFLVSDEGSYPVSVAFGFTGEQIRSLDDAYTQIVTSDRLYNGKAQTTDVEVWYRGTKLTEGTDYIIGEYSNNVNVTTESQKAQVEIIGYGAYTGTVIGQFEISYLELDDRWITISGVEGDNDFYISDVSILPAPGYEFVVDGETAQITMTTDGDHTETFQVRRISDGAMTDFATRSVSIDKTAPTGTITMDETTWSNFLETITFGLYKVQSLAATVTAEDANGVSKTEYVISDTAYASVTELEAANLSWSAYSDLLKPTIRENENQIIYVRITDMAGNVGYISSNGLYVDTVAPEVSVEVVSITNSGLTFSITSNEAGKYYYAVQKAADVAPTADQLKQGTSGVISTEQAGKPITLSVSGLDSNTAYVVYTVAVDTVIMLSDGSAAENTSEVVSSDFVVTYQYNLAEADVIVDDALYTGSEVKPAVEVRYNGVRLTEGVDYEVTYHENVEASADKPYVEVTGIGGYTGTLTETFAIEYLQTAQPEYTISGTEGKNGYYISGVAIAAKTGYELVAVENSQFNFSKDGAYETKFRVRRISDGAMTDVVTLKINVDQTAPTGSVAVDTNVWTELLNTITFGLFFNESKEAVITAADTFSGVASIGYVISDHALDLNGLKAQTWNAYTKPVAMDADGNYIVYAKLTDNAGNVSYLGSDGLVIDTVAPDVYGIVDGGEYATEVTFTVDSDTVSVTVDGKVVYDTTSSGGITLTASETPQKIVITDRAGNETVLTVTVYPPRVVTFVADGKTVDTIEVDYGADLTSDQFPEIPAKTGYDQTAPKWDSEGLTDIKENTTVTAIYTINTYTVTAPETQTGYTVKLDNTTVTHGGSASFTVEIAEGYNGTDMIVTVNGEQIKPVGDVYTVKNVTSNLVIEVSGVKDSTAPETTVTVGTNIWKKFLNTITFGLFYNETKEATITATDEGSGVYAIYYLISDGPVAIDDLAKSAWTPYTAPVSMAAEGNYVVYAKAVDNAGNVCYVNSNGVVIDTTAPSVDGIEDGGVYYGDVVFSATDVHISTVTVDGKTVYDAATDGAQAVITLKPAESQQKIVITDKAGNETVLMVTVKDAAEEPKDEVCDGIHDCPSRVFSDLNTTKWYHLYTDYVIKNGIMYGYGDGTFGPGDTLSRAMVVQVLYNLEGRPSVTGTDNYTDTEEGKWYSDAIVWGMQNGIIKGYGNGKFGPNDAVTREQMVTMFYRYSEIKGYSLTEGSYDHFSDAARVSAYADSAMKWAVGNGLIIGTDEKTLCPGCDSTRAEFATVMRCFIETIAK